MSIDPDDPGRKTVFKVNTNKLGFSKNTPEACGYCQRKRSDGETPLRLCSGCRSIRFCNAEHQKAYWPQHKAICKDAQKRKQMQDEFGAPEEFALAEHRRHLVEDWVAIHRYTISQAMAWAFQDSAAPMNFRSQYFEFRVKFRPEGEDNPSTSFFLDSAAVRPIRGSPAAAPAITVGLPKLERLDAEQRAAGTRGFLGVFSCLYLVDNVPLWTSAMDIYADGIPPHRPADTPWYCFLQYCSHIGLVFRLVGPRSNNWRPGIMGKKGNKWVWKENTLEELAAQGIHISQGSERGKADFDLDLALD